MSSVVCDPEESVEIQELVDEQIKRINSKAIILYNDDHNTFEHVIECLMKYCKHTMEQAEQCTVLVHYKGKCDVKRGSFQDLKPICEALLENGLTAKIEE